jgi:hypothetical protein
MDAQQELMDVSVVRKSIIAADFFCSHRAEKFSLATATPVF